VRTRSRILLVAVVAFLPAVALYLFSNFQHREWATREFESNLARLAHVSGVEYERYVEESRALLATLAAFPEVADGGPNCSRRLASILPALEQYTTLSLIGLDGYLSCGSLPADGQLYLGDREYFRKAVSNRRFSVGSYAIGRITGNPIVGMALPIVSEDALDVEAVLAVALNLNTLGNTASRMNLPSGATFTVLDGEGVVMVRVPEGLDPEGLDVVGAKTPAEYMALVSGMAAETVAMGTDLDGVERRLAVTSLRGIDTGADGYLVIGGDEAELAAQSDDLARGELVLLLIALGVLMVVVWTGVIKVT